MRNAVQSAVFRRVEHGLRAGRGPGERHPGNDGPRTLHNSGGTMYLVREVMYCKPGKVKPMVEKFLAMDKLGVKVGMPKMRIMTDFCADRYWTIVAEMEVPTVQAFEDLMLNPQGSEADMKEFENLMKGYHDLVEYGKREVYKIEG